VKTSSNAHTFHLAAYKTTAHRRCVNVRFNDDFRFLVIVPWSLLQIIRRLHGVTFRKAVITHKQLEVSKKTNGVLEREKGQINHHKTVEGINKTAFVHIKNRICANKRQNLRK
jgi:hypothetical protein